ncbi:MAG TPA: hypothetical protein VNK04_12430 [Gemmataceae bacterium]|nr:hypothetical protein [Gemmataceae bacterium]
MLPPRHFPQLDIGLPPPQFLNLPREVERTVIGMRITESLLKDPDYERRWWGPLRQHPDQRPQGLPTRLRVDYRWNRPAREAALKA